MKNIFFSLTTISIWLTCSAQVPLRPFPQHETYTLGTIKPTNFTQSQLDDSTSFFYDQWKAVYLHNDCGAGQYYVWFNEVSANNSISVSEGQGYGMLITAYMAGYDPSAKTYFDGLYNFYNAHPSINNANLMAWNQIIGCIDDPAGGNDGATDGDLDIAYALLLADKQWGSGGTINYLLEALNIINAAMLDNINQNIWTTKLGDWAIPTDTAYNDTRPSDFMLNHFRAFQTATNDSNWNDVINECYLLINTMQTNFSSTTGLLPDFIQSCNTTPTPAFPNYLESAYDGDFNYNACRTPWRIAMDYLISGDTLAKIAVEKMNSWIKIKTTNDPTQIGAGYYLIGSDIPGNNYSSAAFIGPFAVSAMVNSANQTWLNNIYTHLLSLQLPNYFYYDNTLKMLSLIVLSGNWWTPPLAPIGIDNNISLNSSISVYPNPSNGKFTIYTYNKINSIEIYNILGERIFQSTDLNFFPLGGQGWVIDISESSNGIYFLKIYDGTNVYSKKIIIQQ